MTEESDKYPPPSPLTDYYTGVGRVAMAWATFETTVNLTIWELANVEQFVGACITAQIGNPVARFRALVALVRLRGGTEQHINSINSMSTDADKLGRQRNRYVHDPVFRKKDTGDFHKLEITADRKLTFSMDEAKLNDMRDLEKKITKMAADYQNLAQQILDELPTFDRTRFQQSEGISHLRPATDSGS